MSNRIITLDIREDIRNGREPFLKIMSTATALDADEKLLVIAPFEPVPLFQVMQKKGFQHQTRAIGSGDWEVLFSRNPKSSAGDVAANGIADRSQNQASAGSVDIPEVDARGLEPPQPMVKILEALAALPDGAELRARTDRRPMHLYPMLEERGFTAETQDQSDGSFLTQIRRR
ncbi:MAG TPA: DUF2249 domain-containing protein [Candidatus Paceibacterota bacterium]|nr:DUF2249 domain-containing protein [Candidatus Paceibacterota bacterium]